MLREADRAFVIEPKCSTLARDAQALCVADFAELLPLVPASPDHAPVGA